MKAGEATSLGMVGVDRPMRSTLEDRCDKAGQRTLGSTLHKDAGTVGVHALNLSNPLHGCRNLLSERVDDLLPRAFSRRVVPACDVGGDGTLRGLHIKTLKHLPERRRCRRHNRGVEGVAHGERVDRDSTRDEGLDGRLYGPRCTGDNSLRRAVLVRRDDVPWYLSQDFLHDVDIGSNAGHATLVLNLYTGHLTAASADRNKGILEAENSGRNSGGVLAQRVSSHHVGHHAMGRQQAHDRDVDRERRRLRNLSVSEALKLILLRDARITPNEVRERAAQLLGHHLVRFVEGCLDNGILGREVEAHVDVLRPLAGEEEGHLSVGRGVFNIDATPPQHLYRAVLSEHL